MCVHIETFFYIKSYVLNNLLYILDLKGYSVHIMIINTDKLLNALIISV